MDFIADYRKIQNNIEVQAKIHEISSSYHQMSFASLPIQSSINVRNISLSSFSTIRIIYDRLTNRSNTYFQFLLGLIVVVVKNFSMPQKAYAKRLVLATSRIAISRLLRYLFICLQWFNITEVFERFIYLSQIKQTSQVNQLTS